MVRPRQVGPDLPSGVRRPSRAVSLFDFDEFDRMISEGTSEAERNPWDLVVDPVTGELVERDTVGSPELAELHGEQRADLGMTAEDEANLSETVERILAERWVPASRIMVTEPWSNEDWEFLHTAIRDEIRHGRSSEQPSVFTNPDHTRWDVEIALEIEEQITPSGMDERDWGSDRSQGLSDEERALTGQTGGFMAAPSMASGPGGFSPPPRQLPNAGGFAPSPALSGPGGFARSPLPPFLNTIMAGGGQESLPGLSPEEIQYDINRRGIDEARRILEEARRRAEEKAKQPRPAGPAPQQGPPIPPRPDQLDAIRHALLAAGVGGAGMGAMRTFGGGGILGGLGSGMSLR